MLYIWRIQGEASNDSGGGLMEIYAITEEPYPIPDVDHALKEATKGKYSWYWINCIEQIFRLPRYYDADSHGTLLKDFMENLRGV